MFILRSIPFRGTNNYDLLVVRDALFGMDFFAYAGVIIMFWANSLYMYHGFIRITKSEYAHIMNLNKLEDSIIEKIMEFLDKLGIKSVDNRKNQKLFEAIEKFNWKNCLYCFLWTMIWLFPRLIFLLIFVQIKKILVRLFVRVTLLVKCGKNLLLNSLLLNTWSKLKDEQWRSKIWIN